MIDQTLIYHTTIYTLRGAYNMVKTAKPTPSDYGKDEVATASRISELAFGIFEAYTTD